MLEVAITSFAYDSEEILKNIEFNLRKGEHLAVLGESGCGKSTLLHIIYGLLDLNEGAIFWDDTKLLGPKFNLVPGEDFIKLVAQEFNVMPFTTVAENVGEHLSRLDAKNDADRISELLEVVELSNFSGAMVKTLSGGQKQRVALAKALAKQPQLLLLDEPFSHIDTFRKNKLRRKLYRYLRDHNITCITATHDASEALAFADKLLLLKDGTTEAYGTSGEVYSGVKTIYQAGFFDEVNVIPSELLEEKSTGDKLLFPHQLVQTRKTTPLKVIVQHSYFKGSHYLIESKWNDSSIFFEAPTALETNRTVFLSLR